MKFLSTLKEIGFASMYAVKVVSDTKVSIAKVGLENVFDVADQLREGYHTAKELAGSSSIDAIVEHQIECITASKLASNKRRVNYANRILKHDSINASNKAKALALKTSALGELRGDYDAYLARRAQNRCSRFLVDACLGKVYSYYPKDWVKSTRVAGLNNRKNGVASPVRSLSIWDMAKSCLIVSGSFGTIATAIVLL